MVPGFGTADGRGGDTNDGIGRSFDAWLGDVLEADIADTVINDSFHGYSVTPTPNSKFEWYVGLLTSCEWAGSSRAGRRSFGMGP